MAAEGTFRNTTPDRLKYIGITSLDEIVNRLWLRTWIKAGTPIDQKSPYYKKQILFKHVFESILKEQNGIRINLNAL